MIKKLLKLTLIIPTMLLSSPAFAAGCVGNILEGTLVAEGGEIIYLSSDAWNAAFPADPSPSIFNTYYDVSDPVNPFSGQAYSFEFGFLNFTGMGAYFADVDIMWGGWDGIIDDLSGVTYIGPGFSGSSSSSSSLTGGALDNTDDWLSGAGTLDFGNALLTGTMGGGCPVGDVNLFVNGTPSYTQIGSCPTTTVDLTWAATDVVLSSCTTGSGPWSPSGSRQEINAVDEETSVSIADGNSVVFELTCIENGSGAIVTGTAVASCSEIPLPPSGTGTIIPDYIQT